MPKRIVMFLIAFCLVIAWTVVAPVLERASQESTSINTSLSTSPYGYKALYLLMGRLQQKPVTLWEHSMMRLPQNKPKTIWFLEPGPGLFFDGKTYGRQMQTLVDQGYHLVFVLDNQHLSLGDGGRGRTMLDYLNMWYRLNLDLETYDLSETWTMPVVSYFENRSVDELAYQQPRLGKKALLKRVGMMRTSQSLARPKIAFFSTVPSNARVLLEDVYGNVLAARYPRGKGSVTVLPSNVFFQNAQLNQGDNAALALAIQESLPSEQPILFEVYSAGFRDNRDIITYLASGQGVLFLLSLLMVFVGLMVWIMNRPRYRQNLLATSNERYFTQEAFIDALSQHYIGTGRWQELYQKLLNHFQAQLEQRYPGLTLDECLQLVAQNPFHEVSLKEMEAIFVLKNIRSEEAFIQKSQTLLEIQNRLGQYEHHRTAIRHYHTVKARR